VIRLPKARSLWRANLPLIRIAAVAAGVAGVLYLMTVVSVDLLVRQTMTQDVDQRLQYRLSDFRSRPFTVFRPQPRGDPSQPYSAPIFTWVISTDGDIAAITDTAPTLPTSLRQATTPRTARISGQLFRIAGDDYDLGPPIRPGSYHIVVGQEIDTINTAIAGMAIAEVVAGVPLLLIVFFGALVVARRSVAPVERARRRQLAFTADASHELRTPLTVIEAEASLALSRERDASAYQEALSRITVEAGRLRRIVEDLLFLARFDAEPDRSLPRLADLSAAAEEAARRFRAPAEQRRQTIISQVAPGVIAPVPGEWAERLLGVLVDNACRYSPAGGRVRILVTGDAGRARLQVDDSGPGIPAADRSRIFDRFARASPMPGGAGLGLAIADAVVRATGGRWEVGESDLGGARFSVTWPAARGIAPGQPAMTTGAEPAG
jgi:signal transduction histidine kinase